MIADLILTAASVGFVGADLKQAWKLFKNKQYDVSAFSITHFRLKLTSLALVIAGYLLLNVYLALSVAISQLILNIYIANRIGWRHKKSNIPKPFVESELFKILNNDDFDSKYVAVIPPLEEDYCDNDLYGGGE